MGLEYRIPFNFQPADVLRPDLSAAPHFAGYDMQHELYLYRADVTANPKQMPDVTAAVGEYGFYFCEYGDQSVSGDVMAYLRSFVEAAGQKFVVEDLE